MSKFKYLGSVIQSNGDIDGDVTHRIHGVGLSGGQQPVCFVIKSFLVD